MTLFIIPTPIGNLGDITFRAVETLKEVDVICCEDKRRVGVLLKHFSIPKKDLLVYNDVNKKKVTPVIVSLLKEGKNVGLVSDAGTPTINDPGFFLIREVVKQEVDVVPLPGACAAITGLSASGLASDKFFYFGFLSKTQGKRRKEIEMIKDCDVTAVVYESPYRLLKTLKDMREIMPDYPVVVGRELTKKFEEFIRGTAEEVYSVFEKRGSVKGEIVLIVGKKEKSGGRVGRKSGKDA